MLPWLAPSSSDADRHSRVSAVRDTSLAKLVRDDVLGAILRGDVAPGQRINEPDVAARLKVSRVPVREALRELESSGLVVARKHSGVFVREIDATEVHDLYALRGLLDGFAGRCAAQRPAPERKALLGVLDGSIAAMREAASAHDVQRYYGENLRFHWAIVEGAANRQLAGTYRTVVQKLHLSRLKNLSHDVGMRRSIGEHVKIATALRAGDANLSESLLISHVGGAYARLPAVTPSPTDEDAPPRAVA